MSNVEPDYSYQPTDARRLLAALKAFRRVLYVLPTGGGKTNVAGLLILQWQLAGNRVLILVHRGELLEQMYRTLTGRLKIPKGLVGVIWQNDERTNREAPIQIASIDTAIRRKKFPRADYLVLDEAHHGVAKKWQRVVGWYPEARILGLTATPMRLDGKPLRDAFDELVEGPNVLELIRRGVLLMPRCFARKRGRSIDVKKLRVVAGDYHKGELERRSRRKELVGDIIAHIQQHAGKRTGIVFAAGIKHAEDIARRLGAAKFKAVVVTHKTPLARRKEILGPRGLLDRGKIQFVVNYELIGEGYDLPSVGIGVLARKTMSEALHMHQCGRLLRQSKGKAAPIILDHAGNCLTHGCPQDVRDWSLSARRRRGHETQAPRAKVCAECEALNAIGATTCVECGAAFPEIRMPLEREEQLVEIDAEARLAKQKKAWEKVIRERAAKRLAGEDLDVFVGRAIKARFGENGAAHA